MNTIQCTSPKITFPIAIVVSRFNEKVTHLLRDAALNQLRTLNFLEEQITVVEIPGAVEIPITAQRLAKTGWYEAIICLGAVIHGETDHYDYVCQQVSQGCQRVALKEDIPVIFGILTTHNEEQALARATGTNGVRNAGKDAADTAVEMVAVLREINNLRPN